MPELRPSESKGDANVALLLTWFLPGAGHAYLGRVQAAALWFVLLEGLYALGWWLSDGRSFEFLDPELRGNFATILSPEVGNLGAMIAQLKVAGFGASEPAPFPPHVHLGSIFTALSGIGNAFAMVHAHLLARTPKTAQRQGPSPTMLVAATWFLPGLGHVLQGRRARGFVVMLLLVGLFAVGTLLSEGSNLSRERHFYYWAGQFLAGGPAILTELVSGRPPITGEIRFVDVGLLYACMGGLLNVLAMLDVFNVAEQRWLARPNIDVPVVPAGDAAADGVKA
ncbi:MAG: DUF6677 family protein [Planctomycetota bacterium]